MITLLAILFLSCTAHRAYTAEISLKNQTDQQVDSVLSRTEKIALYRELASDVILKNRTDLTVDDWGNLASFLDGSALPEIHLNGSSVTDAGLAQLMPVFLRMPNLQQISLYQTHITDVSIVPFCNLLGSCSLPLKRIDLRANELGPQSLAAIKALKIIYPGTKIEVSLSAEMLKDIREESQQ